MADPSGRSPLFVDDEAIQRMIQSFGPLEYSQFEQLAGARVGSTILEDPAFDYTGGNWSSGSQARSKKKSSQPPSPARPAEDQQYVLPQAVQEENTNQTEGTAQAKQTLLEWFDRSVEKELKKRREPQSAPVSPSSLDPVLASLKLRHATSYPSKGLERVAEASASRIEIDAGLKGQFVSELTDAVDKLSKAETMCSYAEALQAAEEAALNAPPDLKEQAACAGARKIDTEIIRVHETTKGFRPIEVVGYVGVTKPVVPKKSK